MSTHQLYTEKEVADLLAVKSVWTSPEVGRTIATVAACSLAIPACVKLGRHRGGD